ncbi:MAG: YdcF family protein [Bacteroidota bacterium]
MSVSIKRSILWVTIGGLACFLAGAIAIGAIGLHDHVAEADLAVVPGNTINPDGTPSKRLQGRLDAALVLFNSGHCRAILVSGGIGSEGYDEAEVMKAYLVANGVPASAIFTDNQGVNTFETARYTAKLVREKGFNRPILVSQFFHIARFKVALGKHGLQSGGNVHSRYYELRDVYSLAREVFGCVGYAIRRTQSP